MPASFDEITMKLDPESLDAMKAFAEAVKNLTGGPKITVYLDGKKIAAAAQSGIIRGSQDA